MFLHVFINMFADKMFTMMFKYLNYFTTFICRVME